MDNIKDVVLGLFKDLQAPEKTQKRQLLEKWPAIVGGKLAKHTKPLLNEKGILTVWVDQSTLAFELKQRYQDALLKRVRAALGEEAVSAIRFYVGQIR